jgi:hypothetical protein
MCLSSLHDTDACLLSSPSSRLVRTATEWRRRVNLAVLPNGGVG